MSHGTHFFSGLPPDFRPPPAPTLTHAPLRYFGRETPMAAQAAAKAARDGRHAASPTASRRTSTSSSRIEPSRSTASPCPLTPRCASTSPPSAASAAAASPPTCPAARCLGPRRRRRHPLPPRRLLRLPRRPRPPDRRLPIAAGIGWRHLTALAPRRLPPRVPLYIKLKQPVA